MSKLVFILCVVLFASTASAFFFPNLGQKGDNELAIRIQKLIADLEASFEKVEKEANETIAKIEAMPDEIRKTVLDSVSTILTETENNVNAIISKSSNVDVSSCTKIGKQLGLTALFVVTNMTSCVTDKFKEAGNYISNVIHTAGELRKTVTGLAIAASKCFDDVENLGDGARAVICANAIGIEAAWHSLESIPSFATNVFGLVTLVGTLQQSLSLCIPIKGIATLTQESWTIIDMTKNCVQQMINEIGGVNRDVNSNAIETAYSINKNIPFGNQDKTQYRKVSPRKNINSYRK